MTDHLILILLKILLQYSSAERSASDTAVKHFSLLVLASLPVYALGQAQLLEFDPFPPVLWNPGMRREHRVNAPSKLAP